MSSSASSCVSTWSFSSVSWMDGALSNSVRISSRRPAERLQQHGDVLAALAVDADADGVLLVDVELEPRTAAGDDLGDEDVLVGGLVEILGEVGARGTHELRHDDTLGAVDDEGAPTGHDREVPHEDFLFLDLAGHLVDEGGFDEQRLAVRDVLVAALLFGGLDVLELCLPKYSWNCSVKSSIGETSSRTSFRPSYRSQSNDSRWMPTRSGSGRTSSSLEKLTRSRTGTSWSGKRDPSQGN